MSPLFSSLFALFFAGSRGAAAGLPAGQAVVTVNGTPILQSEVMERLWKRHGPQTLDEMIDELLLRQAAAKRGLKVDSADVDKRVAKLEDQFGSRALLLAQLEQADSSLAKVRADLADEILRERLIAQAKGLLVAAAELEEAFQKNKDKLGRPEAVHLRHILVETADEAKDVVVKLKSGADFKALARERSLAASGKAVGGDYGFVARGMLPSEIDQIAFAMKPGETRIVPGPRGQHVLQVLEARPAKPVRLAEVKDDLRELLLTEKIRKAAPDYLRELRRQAEIKTPGAAPPAP
ncbi:MAG: peptidyl-prolyl cis-trans isomerase [Elusimicrobia bacterium]|nr:peptidyl-prolyl cis-trans isomerase [Elusimicrobiota bacterium]